MLKPYLDGITVAKWVKLDVVREEFYTTPLDHKLYGLRTIFYTHCVSRTVAESAQDKMVECSNSNVKDTYTDLPDSQLKQKATKLIL